MHRIFGVILVVAGCAAAALIERNPEGCVLPVPRFAFFMPLVFDPSGDLIQTEHVQNVTLLANDRVVLSCYPGYFKKMPTEQVLRASCKGGEVMSLNGVEKNWLKDLACEVRPIEEVLTPVQGCPADMESVEFGYANPIKEETLILGEACYSAEGGFTKFIHMKVGDPASQEIAHLRTEGKDYLKRNHPTSKYKMDLLLAARLDELNERLQRKLGSTRVPFIEARHYVDAVGLQNKQFSSILKLGWNFFAASGYDLVPNWDALLEDVVQRTVGGKTLDLYMGTHGILSLPGSDGKKVDIYLNDDEQRFPVAKYLWMIVHGRDGTAVFVVLNSNGVKPTDTVPSDDEVCESKCEQMPWLHNLTKDKAHTKVVKGKVWCCDAPSIAAKVPNFPQFDGNSNLLV